MQANKFYLFVVVGALLAGYAFDIEDGLRNFFLTSVIVGFQCVTWWTMRRQSRAVFIFRMWSKQWMMGIVFSCFLIYSFLEDQMNHWNYLAIGEASLFGLLYVIQHRFITYCIGNNEIRNLSTGDLIDLSSITNISVDNTAIRIDTTKYENHLILKADILHSPDWDQLVNHLPKTHLTQS